MIFLHKKCLAVQLETKHAQFEQKKQFLCEIYPILMHSILYFCSKTKSVEVLMLLNPLEFPGLVLTPLKNKNSTLLEGST